MFKNIKKFKYEIQSNYINQRKTGKVNMRKLTETF